MSIGPESLVTLQGGFPEQKDAKTLSDLFSTRVGDSNNPEGQSFFDSISNAPRNETLLGNLNPASGDSLPVGKTQHAVPQPPESLQTKQETSEPLQPSQAQPLIESLVGLDVLNEPLRTPSMPTTPDSEDVMHGKQSEYERTSSAWIPSPQTKQLLATVASGMTNSLDVDQKFLTSPSIVLEEPKVSI